VTGTSEVCLEHLFQPKNQCHWSSDGVEEVPVTFPRNPCQ